MNWFKFWTRIWKKWPWELRGKDYLQKKRDKAYDKWKKEKGQ